MTGAFPANWGNSAHAPSTFREPRGMAILGGDLAGWVKFMTAYHVATLYQTGRMRMTKGHQGVCAECTASAEKEIADPNERFP